MEIVTKIEEVDSTMQRGVVAVSQGEFTPAFRLTKREPDPQQPRQRAARVGCAEAVVVGVAAFSSRLLVSKLVPSKRRYLVPPMLHDGYPAESVWGRPQAVRHLIPGQCHKTTY
jgi:hypothetical protein